MSGDVLDDARRVLGLAYQLAAVQLTKIGEADLSWIAADRGLSAARAAGDVVLTGTLLRSVAHALQATGRYREAVQLTNDAANYLEPHLANPTPELLSVYGTLFLAGSIAAARANARLLWTSARRWTRPACRWNAVYGTRWKSPARSVRGTAQTRPSKPYLPRPAQAPAP